MNRFVSGAVIACSIAALSACRTANERSPSGGGTGTTTTDTTTTTDRTMTGSGADATTGAGVQEALAKVHMINRMEIDAGMLGKERASNKEVKTFADRLVRDHQNADQRVQEIARQRGIDVNQLGMGMGMSNGTMREHGTMGAGSTGAGSPGAGGMGSTGTTPAGGSGSMGTARGSTTTGGTTGAGTGSTGSTGSTGAHDTHASGSGSMMGSGMDANFEVKMRESMAAMDRLKTLRGKEFDVAFLQQMQKDHEMALSTVKNLQSQSTADASLRPLFDELVTTITSHRDEAQRLLSVVQGDRKPVRGTDNGTSNGTTQPQRK